MVRRSLLLGVCLSVCIGLGSASVWAATIVELRDQVTLAPQAMIQLKDIAQVSGSDPAVATQLGEMLLTPAPVAGRSVRVTFEDVRSRMQAIGANLVEVEFRGRQACEVRISSPVTPAAPVNTVSLKEPLTAPRVPVIKPVAVKPPSRRETEQATDTVLQAFRRAFRAQEWESQGWDIRCELEPAAVSELAGISSDQLRFREAALTPGETQPLSVSWNAENGTAHSVRVSITVASTPLVLALKQSLPAGAIVRPDDLEWVKGDGKSVPALRIADAIGKQTQRNLRSGHVLVAEDLAAIPLVRSNDIVTVWVRYGGVTVRRPFKALATGALGESVTLMALDDPRVRIQAEVTGYHEASLTADPSEPRNLYRDGRGDIPLAEPTRPFSEGGRP